MRGIANGVLFVLQYLLLAFAVGNAVMFGLRLLRHAGVEGGGAQVGMSLVMLGVAAIAGLLCYGVARLRRWISPKPVRSIQVQ